MKAIHDEGVSNRELDLERILERGSITLFLVILYDQVVFIRI